MQKTFRKSAIILSMLMLFISCQNVVDYNEQEPFQKADNTAEFIIKIEQTALFDNSLLVEFRSVNNDSRCPEEGTCVWEGLAEIELLFEIDGEKIRKIFSTNEKSVLSFNNYTIELTNLNNKMNLDGSHRKEDYVVTLNIYKKA